MINILVMTHGEMAAGMYHTVGMVLGEQENFSYLAFRPDQSLDSLVENLKEKLAEFNNDMPYLVLVDLFCGSPSNAIVQLISEGYDLQALAGVNLSMLIAALTERGMYEVPAELARQAADTGVESVINIVEKLMEE